MKALRKDSVLEDEEYNRGLVKLVYKEPTKGKCNTYKEIADFKKIMIKSQIQYHICL